MAQPDLSASSVSSSTQQVFDMAFYGCISGCLQLLALVPHNRLLPTSASSFFLSCSILLQMYWRSMVSVSASVCLSLCVDLQKQLNQSRWHSWATGTLCWSMYLNFLVIKIVAVDWCLGCCRRWTLHSWWNWSKRSCIRAVQSCRVPDSGSPVTRRRKNPSSWNCRKSRNKILASKPDDCVVESWECVSAHFVVTELLSVLWHRWFGVGKRIRVVKLKW